MDYTTQTFSHVYPSTLEASRLVADDLKQYCKEFSLSTEAFSELELCVVEIVNNAFIHAYKNTEGQVVEVELSVRENEYIKVSISDFGSSMTYEEFGQAINGDFIEPKLEDPETWTTSGRGFIIISALLDDISLNKSEGKNTFILTKNF